MMRTAFDKNRDERIADDVVVNQAFLCTAKGCPNRWSVDAGAGRCCSAHAWAEPHLWPQITQEQLDAEGDRALRNSAPPPAPATRSDVPRLKRELAKLADGIRHAHSNPRGWAHELRDHERRGGRINDAQKVAWRAALGAHSVLDQALQGVAVPEVDITAALLQTGDIPWPDRLDVPAFDEESTDA